MKIKNFKKLNTFFIVSLVILFSCQVAAQSNQQSETKNRLHSFELKVSDVDKSLKFYQSLFDAPILYREKSVAYLGLGRGGAFMSLSLVDEGESLGFTHIGVAVKNFNDKTLKENLIANGLTEGEAGSLGLSAAMTFWGEDFQNSSKKNNYSENKASLRFIDYEGVQFRLLSDNYCLHAEKGSSVCEPENEGNNRAPMSLLGINHFTTFVANFERANSFYKSVLGISTHVFQGTFPTLGVGDGYQFLMFVGGAQQGQPSAAANIHHVSLAVENFDVEKIQTILNDKGLTFVKSGSGAVPPLSHYVSLRMPERGGVEGGTPELYFTDPDGLRIQLQDISYCGGGGYLGDECKK